MKAKWAVNLGKWVAVSIFLSSFITFGAGIPLVDASDKAPADASTIAVLDDKPVPFRTTIPAVVIPSETDSETAETASAHDSDQEETAQPAKKAKKSPSPSRKPLPEVTHLAEISTVEYLPPTGPTTMASRISDSAAGFLSGQSPQPQQFNDLVNFAPIGSMPFGGGGGYAMTNADNVFPGTTTASVEEPTDEGGSDDQGNDNNNDQNDDNDQDSDNSDAPSSNDDNNTNDDGNNDDHHDDDNNDMQDDFEDVLDDDDIVNCLLTECPLEGDDGIDPTIDPTAVPLPGTGLVFMTGLAAIAALRRKKKIA